MESEKYPPDDRLLRGYRAAQRRDVFLCRFAHRASTSLVVGTPQTKLLHFSFNAKGDMFGGVAFGGFEIAVHEFGPRQGELHIECDRAGKFVIGEFGAHQLTDASRLIVEAERRQNPYLVAKRGKGRDRSRIEKPIGF